MAAVAAAENEKRRVCVTGAGGFVASWLVKLLLSKGYIVHGTVKDPRDPKNAHLKKLNPTENLHLFKADLLDFDSNAAAIAGCEGVFHVASPVPAVKVLHPEEVIAPAVTGTLNVLNAACSEAKVKRVVVVSSLAAAIIRPDSPEGGIVDEDCWSDEEYCRKTENWYSLSKTLAEREALDFAEKHGLSVVTLCPCLVIGPLLQPTVNASCLFLINLLKGARESLEYKIICVVDVRDVADALLLMYEKPEASGRYFCAPYALKSLDLVDMLKKLCPNYKCPERFTEAEQCNVHSRKLEKLGWKCRTLEESLIDTFAYYRDAGLLDRVCEVHILDGYSRVVMITISLSWGVNSRLH